MSRALDRLPCLLKDDEAFLHYFESLRLPADRLACFHCCGFGHMRPLAGSRRVRGCYCECWYYWEDREDTLQSIATGGEAAAIGSKGDGLPQPEGRGG
jgi:hypothetical protein